MIDGSIKDVKKLEHLNLLAKECGIDSNVIEQRKYYIEQSTKFVFAAYRSDYDELNNLILQGKSKQDLHLYINKSGRYIDGSSSLRYNYSFARTPIEACIFASNQAKSNGTNCQSFRCFELLINQAKSVTKLDFGEILHWCMTCIAAQKNN